MQQSVEVLPMPLLEPIGDFDQVLNTLGLTSSSPAAKVLNQACENHPVFLMFPTGNRVDVGAWVFKPRAWIMVLDDRLIRFGASRSGQRWSAKTWAYADLEAPVYNHATGELVFPKKGIVDPFVHPGVSEEPGPDRVLLLPVEAHQVISQIFHFCPEFSNG
jgi:hypothetical protein